MDKFQEHRIELYFFVAAINSLFTCRHKNANFGQPCSSNIYKMITFSARDTFLIYNIVSCII